MRQNDVLIYLYTVYLRVLLAASVMKGEYGRLTWIAREIFAYLFNHACSNNRMPSLWKGLHAQPQMSMSCWNLNTPGWAVMKVAQKTATSAMVTECKFLEHLYGRSCLALTGVVTLRLALPAPEARGGKGESLKLRLAMGSSGPGTVAWAWVPESAVAEIASGSGSSGGGTVVSLV